MSGGGTVVVGCRCGSLSDADSRITCAIAPLLVNQHLAIAENINFSRERRRLKTQPDVLARSNSGLRSTILYVYKILYYFIRRLLTACLYNF